MSPLTAAEVRALLCPGEAVQDEVLLVVLDALRRAGHVLAVTDVYGIGAGQAAAELHVNSGRRMRITVEPW